MTLKGHLGLSNGAVGSASTFMGSFGRAEGGTLELKDNMDLIHWGVWVSRQQQWTIRSQTILNNQCIVIVFLIFHSHVSCVSRSRLFSLRPVLNTVLIFDVIRDCCIHLGCIERHDVCFQLSWVLMCHEFSFPFFCATAVMLLWTLNMLFLPSRSAGLHL